MTFFNKKTEVMQIEMTPYGRYLYSIGKFKPHSYEFVDDDINYKVSGEAQEDAHYRILNETPKLKVNTSFQNSFPRFTPDNVFIGEKRDTLNINDQKQNGIFALGRSSYSTDSSPHFQLTTLQGDITSSVPYHEIPSSSYGASSSVGIPQIDIPFRFVAYSGSVISPLPLYDGGTSRTKIFSDGKYVEVRYQDIILHLKEFGSFYEKENFEIEVFRVHNNPQNLTKLNMIGVQKFVVDDLLVGQVDTIGGSSDQITEEEIMQVAQPNFVEYYFDIEFDEDIPVEDICKAVEVLEINSQFLDEETICPDRRTDRFNIYSTRVGPDDLEDCD